MEKTEKKRVTFTKKGQFWSQKYQSFAISVLYGSLWYLAIKFQFQTSDIRSWKIEWLILSFVKANLSTIGLETISCNSIQNNGGVGTFQSYIYHNLTIFDT